VELYSFAVDTPKGKKGCVCEADEKRGGEAEDDSETRVLLLLLLVAKKKSGEDSSSTIILKYLHPMVVTTLHS
jgi:hypothetical protein